MYNSTEPQLLKTSLIQSISFWKSRENLLCLAAILIISFMVYLPSLQNGFVNWDDPVYVYKNPYIINISSLGDILENLKEIFTTHVNGSYKPLTIVSFAFEKIIYGLDSPEWWHLDNIILHLFCVLLVFRIALALGLKIIPAAFCALLFGIHPMRVESVAWITERKDVLYGSFYLLALYYYIKSVKLSFQKRYVLIIHLSFILALLSKMTAVALPLSMLAVDYYFDRKLSMKLIYEKWLYFLLSLVTGIIGLYFARVEGLSEVNKAVPILKRIFIGSYSYIVYIVKSVVPYEMVPIYPFPDILDWTFYASMVIALFIFGSIYYFFLNKKKIAVFGLMFFTVNIMFLLQFKIAGKGFLSDRYTYIAYLGLFFVYAFALERILGKYGRQFDKLIYLAALLIIGVSGYMNFEQNMIWKNSETLWSHELKYYDQDPFVWYQRASYYNDNEKLNEALFDYSKSIALNTFNPNAYLNRGIIYARFNMLEKALQDFSAAEKLDPANPKIYLNRAIVYINLARSDKAQSELEKYLALRPNDPDMWSNLGTLRRKNKQYKKSLYAFNRAIQINPDNLVYYNARIKTYYEMGDIKRASDDLNFLKSKGSTGINPDYEAMINQEK